MTSFLKLGIFEREAKAPELNIKQLALLMCGVDPTVKTADIPEAKVEAYNIYYRQLSRWLSASKLFRGGNSTAYPADYMFALAYPLIDEDITPQPIKDRCLAAVALIANQNKGKEHLYAMGGDELLQVGIALKSSKRGLHRKEDEKEYNDKLMGMLVKLIAHKIGHSFGTSKKPSISAILNELYKLADEEGISKTGLSKSAIYDKIRKALNSIYYTE